MDTMLQTFKSELAAAKKQRKTDDILDFMRSNWRLFCPSRSQLEIIWEELEQQGNLNPTVLADALGVPDCVMFKKLKVVETAKAILKLPKSQLYKTFQSTKQKLNGRGLCLIAVAGEHTLVVTDLHTERVPGLVHMEYITEEGDTINVFPADDAPSRMPTIFKRED